jgi:3-oxoacyl-[acyl-carrier-protein] synthase-3
MTRARIAGTGSYTPVRTVRNAELASRLALDPEQIAAGSGVLVRHVAAPNEETSDLALRACIEALDAAGRSAHDVECVILATHTPDRAGWPTGPVPAAKLGRAGIAAFDLRDQCTGFIYALAVAEHFVRLGTYRTVVVAAAEVLFRGVGDSRPERRRAMTVGDGAAAVVVEAASDDGGGGGASLGIGLHADGRFGRAILPSTVVRDPDESQRERPLPPLQPLAARRLARRRMGVAIDEALQRCALCLDGIALVIPSQSSICLSSLHEASFGLAERLFVNRDTRGDTASASLPLGLDDAVRSGSLTRGETALLVSFGVEFTWAWAALAW